MNNSNMLVITRNLQICHGTRSCGLCLLTMPKLEHGPVRIAAWAYMHNRRKIDGMIQGCPAEAIRIQQQ